ncbi:MAG: Gfo/Idh/MocA family protein [Tepidisphaeraceae bacterium]
MSVVLPADSYETIRPVLAHLHRQEVRDQLEIIAVMPTGHGGLDEREFSNFACMKAVDVAGLTPLSVARARGVRAASAPLVFIGETHSYPQHGFAEAILKAFEQPWTAVVPRIMNANPRGVLSWAGYLADYGRWGAWCARGEIFDPLIYNTAYRRAALLELGDDLERALDTYSEQLGPALRARGGRACYEPDAQITHLNVARIMPFVDEKFAAGVLVGRQRAARWPWWRRAVYVLASPLIPLVLSWRSISTVRSARRAHRLPRGTFAAILAGYVARATGEALGYAGLAPSSAAERLTEIEIHKVDYATPRAGIARRPVRVAVLGCGTIAYWAHLRNLRKIPNAILVAAADPDPDARARASALIEAPLFAGHEEVLAREDVDAVVICAPSGLHAQLAVAAADAAKHFYLEKPIATTAQEAQEVLRAAAATGVVGVVGFNFRFHPTHERARELIAHGRIGAIRAVQTVFCEPLPADRMSEWKKTRTSGGGVLLDLASHHVDLLRWFLNDEINTVEAHIDSLLTEHDSARVAMGLRNGVQAQSYFTCRGGPADYLEFIGERGTLRVDRFRGVVTVRVSRRHGYGTRAVWQMPTGEILAMKARRMIHPSYDPSFRRALTAFVDRVSGQTDTIPSLDDGARSLAVVLAAEESARRGGSVPVSSL